MRDSESTGHSGRALGLTIQGVMGQAAGVGASGPGDDSGDRGDDLGLGRAQVSVEGYQFWDDERGVHRFSDLTDG